MNDDDDDIKINWEDYAGDDFDLPQVGYDDEYDDDESEYWSQFDDDDEG